MALEEFTGVSSPWAPGTIPSLPVNRLKQQSYHVIRYANNFNLDSKVKNCFCASQQNFQKYLILREMLVGGQIVKLSTCKTVKKKTTL